MKAAHTRWNESGELMTDQECLDRAIAWEFDAAVSPQLGVTFGDGIDWAEEDALNPYRWRSRSWLYRIWKTDPLPTSPITTRCGAGKCGRWVSRLVRTR